MRRAYTHPLIRISVVVLTLIVVFLSPAASAEPASAASGAAGSDYSFTSQRRDAPARACLVTSARGHALRAVGS